MKEKKEIKIRFSTFILIMIIILLLTYILMFTIKSNKVENKVSNINANLNVNNNSQLNYENNIISDNNIWENTSNIENEQNSVVQPDNEIIDNTPTKLNSVYHDIANFELEFLKMNNEKENKVYSPLSIRYALKMLEEGAEGDTKTQISKLIGNDDITTYNSTKNLSLANGLFIRDTFRNNIKESYINTLKNRYNAEVIFDSFKTPENVNSWISNKTLKLIENMVEDIDEDFLLVNALGIDMEWANKFLIPINYDCDYQHEKFGWYAAMQLEKYKFGENKKEVSGMEIVASINNYDILKELGEENIRNIVSEEFRKWTNEIGAESYEGFFNEKLNESNLKKTIDEYINGGDYYNDGYNWEGYISQINSNYGRIDKNTDFSIYVDNDVKVFAKDLKEYEGTTLQYIGIMPITQDLDAYVSNINNTKINNIIKNLKEIKRENFKKGVVTKIIGFIPKFKFEYDLKLMNNLKNMGITNVFEKEKANLANMCSSQGTYISQAIHKANIEFTQDGIKASAATIMGGAGGGDGFDYYFDVPVEGIDLTFDKPYMFLVRDKDTNDIWFAGTVYEPLSLEEEPEKDNSIYEYTHGKYIESEEN